LAESSLALRTHVLVVDDDDRLRDLLSRYLTENGFLVTTASGAAEARALFSSLAFDALVLDIMMPGETGLSLTQALRSDPSMPSLPVLLLTARGEPMDRIDGLEKGADDYLVKPFEPKELLLRLNAILRRAPQIQEQAPMLQFGKWVYDIQRDELRCDEETVRFTDMEARLMRVLAAQPGVAISREVLAEKSAGDAPPEDQGKQDKTAVNDRTVDVQVTRLRRKIEEDPKNPRYLVTVRGEGYKLMPDIDRPLE
jgi:two-component system phosphate regulon response regulator OmpR